MNTGVPRILDDAAVLVTGMEKASLKPITSVPYWRLRENTWVIKSWRRWLLRGSKEACLQKIQTYRTNDDTRCNERE